MAGQLQIEKYNQESLYDYHSDKLLRQADLYYLKEKFAVKTEYNELETLHSYLLKDILCTDSCEIVKFIDKKVRGVLEDEDIDVVDLKTMQLKHRDIINNYYTTEQFEWETILW